MADHKKVDIESVDKRMEVIIGARVIFKSEKLVFSWYSRMFNASSNSVIGNVVQISVNKAFRIYF